MISATAYDQHVEQLFEVLKRVTSALQAAGIEYRVVGGVAVFLHVSEKDPLAARMTRDIDMAVDRRDLDRIADAVRPFGFEYRHVAGVDMLVDAVKPSARSAVHLVMVREKVRPEYSEAVPDFSPPVETREGVLLAPVADLVRHEADQLPAQRPRPHPGYGRGWVDLGAGRGGLPNELRRRLAEIRSTR